MSFLHSRMKKSSKSFTCIIVTGSGSFKQIQAKSVKGFLMKKVVVKIYCIYRHYIFKVLRSKIKECK